MTHDTHTPTTTTPRPGRWREAVAILLVMVAGAAIGVVVGRSGHDWKETHGLARHEGGQAMVVLSGDEKLIVAAWPDGHAGVWRSSDGQVVLQVADAPKNPTCLAVWGDGALLAVGAADGGVHLYPRGGPGKPVVLGSESADARALAFAGKGDRLACSNRADGLSVWDVASGQCLLRLPPPDRPAEGGRRLTFQADDRVIATVWTDGGISLWRGCDSRTGERLVWTGGMQIGAPARVALPWGKAFISSLASQGNLADGKGRIETVAFKAIAILDEVRPARTGNDAWTESAIYRQAQKPSAAFPAGMQFAAFAWPDGRLSLLRPRRTGDLGGEWQTWAAGAALLALAVWLAAWGLGALRRRAPRPDEPVPANQPRPSPALVIVAALVFLHGVWTVIDTGASVFRGSFYFDVAILNPMAAWGLFRLRHGWRTWLVAQTWLLFAATGFGPAFLAATPPDKITWQLPSLAEGEHRVVFLAVCGSVYLLLTAWIYIVLTSARTRRLLRQAHAYRTADWRLLPLGSEALNARLAEMRELLSHIEEMLAAGKHDVVAALQPEVAQAASALQSLHDHHFLVIPAPGTANHLAYIDVSLQLARAQRLAEAIEKPA